MKWVWVEILCYFTGLRESSRTFFRGTFPADYSSLPESRSWGCIQLASWGQKRPRSAVPRIPMDPNRKRRDLKLFSMQPRTLDPVPWEAFKKVQILRPSPNPTSTNYIKLSGDGVGEGKKKFISPCDSNVQPRLRNASSYVLGAFSGLPLKAREHCGKSTTGRTSLAMSLNPGSPFLAVGLT